MEYKGACHCGKVEWRYRGPIESATACNCTICRRYGVLWAYGYENVEIEVLGATQSYIRGKAISFHFCSNCGCVSSWRGLHPGSNGKTRIAVNLRLIDEPSLIQNLPIDHFDGLNKFEDLPRDHRRVKDLWF